MKTDITKIKPVEKIPGFHGRFIHGKSFTIALWEVKAGSLLPEHSHVHEQSSQVTSGQFELTINGKTEVYEPGMIAVVPSEAIHSGRALTDCTITDIFCPSRPEYSND